MTIQELYKKHKGEVFKNGFLEIEGPVVGFSGPSELLIIESDGEGWPSSFLVKGEFIYNPSTEKLYQYAIPAYLFGENWRES